MMSLITLHRKYLWTKVNLIIFDLLVGIINIGLLVSINPIEQISLHDLNRKSYALAYNTNMEIMMKISLTLISCYLFGSSFCFQNDNYRVLYLSSQKGSKKRIVYFLTKYYALASIYFGVVLVAFLCYMIIGYLFTSWFVIEFSVIEFFGGLFLTGLIFGSVAMIFGILFNNWFSSLIPYIIFIISEIIVELSSNQLIKVFHFVFPRVIASSGEVYFPFGIFHALIIFASFIIGGSIIYLIKDLS
ncbi:MAG TPA: hypothetical protein GXZ35_02940 [Acholeplasmataceae bacterium]|jgi:hypothetical protein|nr:hypothetical protein [Acholeplasmataceae bacterium]